MKKPYASIFLFIAIMLYPIHSLAIKPTIKVGFLYFSIDQRTAFLELGEKFEKETGVRVDYRMKSDMNYKLILDNWLTAKKGLDVLYWQAGERLYGYVRQDLIEPINDVWKTENMDAVFTGASKGLVSYQGDIYAIPFSYYQWGIYYHKQLFDKLNLTPPTTWKELLIICNSLKSHGISPFTIGIKNKWPAAGWFDYLNLRINGLNFHQELMNGKIPYTDERVKKVFQVWKELLDKGYFIQDDIKGWDWKLATSQIASERAAMTLIGNFAATFFSEIDLEGKIGFFRFPQIDPEVPYYEEAPTDVFMIPKNATQKENGKRYLSFIGRADNQFILNNRISMIPPNIKAQIIHEYFVRAGSKILNEAKGISQFYDRDTPKKMAGQGLEIFVQFIENPDVEKTAQALENARQSSF